MEEDSSSEFESTYLTVILTNARFARNRIQRKVWKWEKLHRDEIQVLYGILLDGLSAILSITESSKYTYEDFVFLLYKTRDHVGIRFRHQ